MKQALFELEPDPRPRSTRARFEDYDQRHPEVWDLFVRFATEAQRCYSLRDIDSSGVGSCMDVSRVEPQTAVHVAMGQTRVFRQSTFQRERVSLS